MPISSLLDAKGERVACKRSGQSSLPSKKPALAGIIGITMQKAEEWPLLVVPAEVHKRTGNTESTCLLDDCALREVAHAPLIPARG